jgi:hypothetical protein
LKRDDDDDDDDDDAMLELYVFTTRCSTTV